MDGNDPVCDPIFYTSPDRTDCYHKQNVFFFINSRSCFRGCLLYNLTWRICFSTQSIIEVSQEFNGIISYSMASNHFKKTEMECCGDDVFLQANPEDCITLLPSTKIQ